MKTWAQIISLAMLIAGSACQDLERSRDVGDSSVPGKTLAMQVCSNCHGMTGVSVSPQFPKLAGQQREYLVEQLTDFKTHARSDPNAKRYMWGFTHLTDVQIGDIATYFSSQPPAIGAPSDLALIGAGKAIYTSGLPDKGVAACVTCHGQHGEGSDKFPRIGGQHADYVFKQLHVFQRTADRPRGALMKAVCANMSDEDMQAVAAFVEAFPAEGVTAANPPSTPSTTDSPSTSATD